MAELAATNTIWEPINYQLIDDISEVAAAREQERRTAQFILEQRRNAQPTNEVADLPLPIDALSTAHKVLEAASVFGEDSPEHRERQRGLLLDCQRLVAEWYRKKKPEYFPPTRHIFDENAQEFFSHGLSVRQMTENALRPIADDPEEENRRVNERVEDATPQILRRLGKIAIGNQVIRTISECTDKAITDYRSDIASGRAHRGYGGYVPEIEKVMIRDIRLADGTRDRFEEQVGLPGIYISHEIIQKALERRGATVGHMDKTELHGSQLLASDDLMDFVELLDKVAGEEWCTEIFMGEEVPAGTAKDYASFRQEALRRQEDLKDMAQTVATFVLDLAEGNVDRRLAPALVEDFVKKLLLDVAKTSPVLAEQMFDIGTAQGLQEVAYLESIGQNEQAFERMQQVEKAAPGGGYCSGGSCGLESVNTFSAAGKELAKKVKAEPGDTVVKDNVRSCKCGRKGSIVYAYSKNRVKKYCEGCTAFESKPSKVSAAAA